MIRNPKWRLVPLLEFFRCDIIDQKKILLMKIDISCSKFPGLLHSAKGLVSGIGGECTINVHVRCFEVFV